MTETLDLTLVDQIADSIVATVTRYGCGVSFAEIIQDAHGAGLAVDGDYALANDQMNEYNLVVWAGVSAEFYRAYAGLIEDKILEQEPTSYLTYLCDGMALTLPLAKRLRRYKEPHWVPVSINKGPKWVQS